MLAQLLRGLFMIGMKPQRARELIVKVGLDCIPPVRRLALETLLKQANPLTTDEVAARVGYPEQTVRRSLQDLECHGSLNLAGVTPSQKGGKSCSTGDGNSKSLAGRSRKVSSTRGGRSRFVIPPSFF